MEVGRAIYYILSNTSGVTTITTNIAPIELVQESTLPAITYQVISAPAINTKSGLQGFQCRVQVNCYDDNYSDSQSLAVAVRNALADKAAGTYDTIKIQVIKLETVQDFSDSAGFDGVFHQAMDFTIHFNL